MAVADALAGTVSSTGFKAKTYTPAGTYQPSWAVVNRYAQALAPDATKTLPIVLSTAGSITLPPPATADWTGRYTYQFSSTGVAGRRPYTAGGVVTRFEY